MRAINFLEPLSALGKLPFRTMCEIEKVIKLHTRRTLDLSVKDKGYKTQKLEDSFSLRENTSGRKIEYLVLIMVTKSRLTHEINVILPAGKKLFELGIPSCEMHQLQGLKSLSFKLST